MLGWLTFQVNPQWESFVDAAASSKGSSTGQLLLGDIEKRDGLLARILPPSFKAGESRPERRP